MLSKILGIFCEEQRCLIEHDSIAPMIHGNQAKDEACLTRYTHAKKLISDRFVTDQISGKSETVLRLAKVTSMFRILPTGKRNGGRVIGELAVFEATYQ